MNKNSVPENLIEKMDSLIDQFAIESRRIVDNVAFPYGMIEFKQRGIKSNKFVDDFQFFAFTKSTKTLISIQHLLEIEHNEDVLNLNRSIFENYLSSRYFGENENEIDDFIVYPLALSFREYFTEPNKEKKEVEIKNREKDVVGYVRNASTFKLGKDKNYFSELYGLLCKFTHCNYGVNECYTEDNGLFTLDKINHAELSRLTTIFTFTKIFENVVTVTGEDFEDEEHEERCFQLIRDSKKLQERVFDELIDRYQTNEGALYVRRNKKMREMLKDMKKSLKEELGSVEYINEKN